MNEEQFKDAILTRLSMKDSQMETALKRFVQMEKLSMAHQDEDGTNSNITTTTSTKKFETEFPKLQAAISKELDQFLFQVEKERLTYYAYERDCEYYRPLFEEKETEIARVKQEIVELKQKLKCEQQGKRNREEYMTLTKTINKHPRRSETEKAINEVKKDLAAVEARAKEINTELETRNKQFQLLLYAVNSLQEEVQVDTKKRKAPAEEVPTNSPKSLTGSAYYHVETKKLRLEPTENDKEEVEAVEPVEMDVPAAPEVSSTSTNNNSSTTINTTATTTATSTTTTTTTATATTTFNSTNDATNIHIAVPTEGDDNPTVEDIY